MIFNPIADLGDKPEDLDSDGNREAGLIIYANNPRVFNLSTLGSNSET